MNELVKLVEEWAKEKRLDKAEPEKQMLKVIEEVGEVGAALARNNENDLRDGIGDVVVTLIILAMQNNMDLHECLNQAYSEIKNRQGEMVNGVFVKRIRFVRFGVERNNDKVPNTRIKNKKKISCAIHEYRGNEEYL